MAVKFQFETALKKLEKIVEDLEGGELTLEDSLSQYEEGVKLTQACQKTLKEAEKKIEILSQGSDGTLLAKEFDPEEPSPKKAKKSGSVKKTEVDFDDEDLI